MDKGNDTKPGTGKYIYTPEAKKFIDKSVHSGDWVRREVDILPAILEGINDAWQKGYLQGSKNLADYTLGGFSMGWETSGIVCCNASLFEIYAFLLIAYLHFYKY